MYYVVVNAPNRKFILRLHHIGLFQVKSQNFPGGVCFQTPCHINIIVKNTDTLRGKIRLISSINSE